MAETGCAGSYRARLYQARRLEAVRCLRDAHAVPVQGAMQGCKPLEQNSVAATLETLQRSRDHSSKITFLVTCQASGQLSIGAANAVVSRGPEDEEAHISSRTGVLKQNGQVLQHS